MIHQHLNALTNHFNCEMILKTFKLQNGLPWQDAQFKSLVDICIASFVFCFLMSIFSKKNVQLERSWPILPGVYTWLMVARSVWPNPRLLWMSMLVSVWGIRHALDYKRKGGYKWPPWGDEEDFRWTYARKTLGANEFPLRWHLFNLVFGAGGQNVLLLCMNLPGYVVYKYPTLRMSNLDWALGCLILGLVMLEGIADNEHWAFHHAKNLRKSGGKGASQFITTGLWRFCRHPNYTCEQGKNLSRLIFTFFSIVTNCRNSDLDNHVFFFS